MTYRAFGAVKSMTFGDHQTLSTSYDNRNAEQYLYWVHEDSVTKSKRITDVYGTVMSTVELDPWGADTNRSSNSAFLPQSFATYIRDSNGGQDAMARRYSVGGTFAQPDPYGGSYDFSDPQSLNRYAYVGGDPVNRSDPSGLDHLSQLGPPPQVPILRLPYGGRIVTNTWAPRWRGEIFDAMFGGEPIRLNKRPITEGEPRGVDRHVGDPGGGDPSSNGEPQNPLKGVTGGIAGEQSDPCKGVKSSDLRYDKVRQYRRNKGMPGQGRYVYQTSEQHIRSRHMNPASGASQYFGSFHAVQNTNAYTFDFGNRMTDADGSAILIELNFPLPIVGTDRTEGFKPTGYNTLILENDCRTVVTSHPGRTWQ